MFIKKTQPITDELIGEDDPVCICSARIAEFLQTTPDGQTTKEASLPILTSPSGQGSAVDIDGRMIISDEQAMGGVQGVRLKKAAVVLNGFVHDFASGCWLASLVSVVFLHRFQNEYPEVLLPLGRMERFFFWDGIVLVVVILVTGGGRVFTYMDNFYGPGTEKLRRKMLIIKHVALFAIFGAGTWLSWTMAFH
ncbi:MAG: hypothetical protein OEV89_08125 [Desulfobulbaceae bacterium]|nr:hypothetical protein [Desulfobulbaceae bacterium]